MSKYNFSNLSPYDFELLTRDLINASQGLKLRAFAPGPDQGVDLRGWKSADSQYVIAQCKHMQNSTWGQLKTSITKEKVKLDALTPKPQRYILATSQALSRTKVDALANLLKPYCLSEEDILDQVRLEELLDHHAPVVQAHYKLWLTSTAVMERIFQAPILNRSETYRRELMRSARTFVQPASLDTARNILRKDHTCIISGPPGVGKTTLAEMLILDYLSQGFELIVIGEDVSEIDGITNERRKQVYLYDDFLGRTDLAEKLGKNEDGRIVGLIRQTSVNPNHRFILTTREYILRAARQRYDRLERAHLDPLKCILEMRHYSRLEKGLILYQHLAFGEGISQEDLREFVETKGYRLIVDHPRYTPRHITDALAAIRRQRKAAQS